MSDIILFSITFGFLAGVATGSNAIFGSVTAVTLIAGILYFGFVRGKYFAYSKWLIAVFFFGMAFVCGFVRYDLARIVPSALFESEVGKTVQISGDVSDDPDISSGKVATVLYVGKVGVRVSIKTDENISYGDVVTVAGALARPQNFQTDQGTEFDYISYLDKDNILYVIQNAKLIAYKKDASFSLTRALYVFRHHIESKLSTYLSDPAGGFVEGILLGTKAAIDQDLYDALIRTSTVHIIALSGYNVSVVAEGISATLGAFLPPLASSATGAIGIILFVIMTGATSTAIRAGLMALLVIFSKVSGRPAHSFRIIALAALALILYNPSYLTSDVSFQLSFLALLGLMIVSPTYTSWLLKVKFLPKTLAMLIGETLAAETAVAPFIIYKMGIFSLVSLPTNIVILPFIPLLMLAGFVLICVGFMISPFGPVVGYPVALFANAIIDVIEKAASLPWAAVNMPQIPWILVLVLYSLTGWFFIGKNLTE